MIALLGIEFDDAVVEHDLLARIDTGAKMQQLIVCAPDREAQRLTGKYRRGKPDRDTAYSRHIVVTTAFQHGVGRYPKTAQAMQDGTGKPGRPRGLRIHMQDVIVAAQSVDEGPTAARCRARSRCRVISPAGLVRPVVAGH